MNGRLFISLCVASLILSGCRNTFNGNRADKSQTSCIENGHTYVDLGLSVRWATCNVGAETPDDYGNHFAWAETSAKSSYDWANLKYCHSDMNLSLSKYITEPIEKAALPEGYDLSKTDSPIYFEDLIALAVAKNSFPSDGKKELEASDDAASVNWGGSWRMPTRDEWLELFEKCTWNWTTSNGVCGHVVTSKINGNSIFLPATGLRYGQDILYEGTQGYYWCSSLESENPWQACSVYSNRSAANMGICDRYIGLSVRPVCAQ